MPPKKVIGARKKTGRKPATPKAVPGTSSDQTDAEIPPETAVTETLPPESSGATEIPISESSIPDSRPITVSEEPAKSEEKKSAPAKKIVRRVVRKVTRKVPVRVSKKNDAKEDGESVGKNPDLTVSEEAKGEENLNPNSEKNVILKEISLLKEQRDENPKEEEIKEEHFSPSSESLDPISRNNAISEPISVIKELKNENQKEEIIKEENVSPNSEAQEPESRKSAIVEEVPPPKKTKKVKKVILVKKIIKKPKIAEGSAKAEESGVGLKQEEVKLEGQNETSKEKDIQGEMKGLTECQKRRKTEVFIGGLDKNAQESDLRKVFGKAGEIVEVRMMKDGKTGKNKGYAFIRFATSAEAKMAVAKFSKVEICGKECGAAAIQSNNTLYLGNINRKWKKEDITKILQDLGIEKIDSITLMPDTMDPNCNRGFAFLDFETNKDALLALKKLQKKDAFGGQLVKVDWAEGFRIPDEEEMQKVRAVFAEGIPLSWDENKVKKVFSKYGKIESVALSRDLAKTSRKDYAFVNFATRKEALSCIESFDCGSQGTLKVSMANSMKKGKKRKRERDSFQDKPVASERSFSSLSGSGGRKAKDLVRGQTSRDYRYDIREDRDFHPRVHRDQSSWNEMDYSRGNYIPEHRISPHGMKRPFSSLQEDNGPYSDPKPYTRTWMDFPRSFPNSLESMDRYDYYRPSSYREYEAGQGYGGASDISYEYPRHSRAEYAPYRRDPYSR